MTLRHSALLGLRVVASASARPCDAEFSGARAGVELSNVDVARLLLGDGFEAELARSELDPERARVAWGLERRQWVRTRRLATPASSLDAGDLATAAARTALQRAGIAAERVDVLVTATSTPPRISSSLASRVARELGIGGVALDLRAGGAGPLHGLVAAAQHLAHGASCALVVGVETSSLYLDAHDVRSAWLYGDGAGAVLLVRDADTAERGLVGALLATEHVVGRPFTVPGVLPPTAEALARGDYRFQRPDGAYGAALLELWATASRELVAEFPRECAELAHFAPYAVSRPQLDAACAPLAAASAGRARLVTTLARDACVGAAGALIALDALLESGAAQSGDLIATTAVGGGVHRAALLWRL